MMVGKRSFPLGHLGLFSGAKCSTSRVYTLNHSTDSSPLKNVVFQVRNLRNSRGVRRVVSHHRSANPAHTPFLSSAYPPHGFSKRWEATPAIKKTRHQVSKQHPKLAVEWYTLKIIQWKWRFNEDEGSEKDTPLENWTAKGTWKSPKIEKEKSSEPNLHLHLGVPCIGKIYIYFCGTWWTQSPWYWRSPELVSHQLLAVHLKVTIVPHWEKNIINIQTYTHTHNISIHISGFTSHLPPSKLSGWSQQFSH